MIRVFLRRVKQRFKFYWSINWAKTIYFNLKMFPLKIAKRLPVFIYGNTKLTSLKGKVVINGLIERGMIGFSQDYEMNKVNAGLGEISIDGILIFNGYCQFGKDVFLCVKKDALCELGNMSSIGSRGKVICTESIVLGQYARFGSECQIIDTNFHDIIDLKTKEKLNKTRPIVIGDYNFISNRVSIMKGTITSRNTTIASNTLCNKDYTHLGEHVLIGGVPAKLLKNNIKRDWESESHSMNKNLIYKLRIKNL